MSSVSTPLSAHDVEAIVGRIASRYLWWEPVDGGAHGFERSVAQIMDIGTYDDIRRLEALIDAGRLAAVMRNAAPGWFSARSWEFWRGRLSGHETFASSPPRRGFRNAKGS